MISKEKLNEIKKQIFIDNVSDKEKIEEEIIKEIDELLKNIQSGSDPIDE